MEKQEEFHNLKLNDIYDRIGHKINARKNKKGKYVKVDIAIALHVNPQDISNWSFRERFPWPELFIFSQENKISFDWLLTGKNKDNFMCGWNPESIKACIDLKEILESDDETTQRIIMFAIKEFKEKRELKKKSSELRSGSRKKGTGEKKAMSSF